MIKFQLIDGEVFAVDNNGNSEKLVEWARFVTANDFGQVEQWEKKPDASRYVDGTFTGDYLCSGGRWCGTGLDLSETNIRDVWNPAGFIFPVPSRFELEVDAIVDSYDRAVIAQQVNALAAEIHADNVAAGWWHDGSNIAEKLCLCHSELSEAMEGYRKDLMDDHLPHREMMEVELADAVIRILDLSKRMGYNIGDAIQEKREYNKHRADHKPENRAKAGGKKF